MIPVGTRVQYRGQVDKVGKLAYHRPAPYQNQCYVVWDGDEQAKAVDVENLIVAPDNAYKVPSGFGIKVVHEQDPTTKEPFVTVSLRKTERHHVRYEGMVERIGAEDLFPPRSARTLEELSVVVGELIAEAIELKGIEDAVKDFKKNVVQWSEDTGVKLYE